MTVIALDLYLYERVLKIRNFTSSMNYMMLRMGELHVVFMMNPATIKVLALAL